MNPRVYDFWDQLRAGDELFVPNDPGYYREQVVEVMPDEGAIQVTYGGSGPYTRKRQQFKESNWANAVVDIAVRNRKKIKKELGL